LNSRLWPRLLLIPGLLWFLLTAGCEQASQLERIQAQGELVVATRQAATSFYQGADGFDGLEYQLVQRFAQELGVKVRFVFPRDVSSMLRQLRRGTVHMAAAGFSMTEERQRIIRFGQPYQTITEQLVYRRETRRPRALDQIAPGELHVVAGSSHEETLRRLRTQVPSLSWTSRRGVSQDDLLQAVNRGEIAFTVADSNELAMARRIHRYLRPALELGEPTQLAWAFPMHGDGSLQAAANHFVQRLQKDGSIARLLEHFYGHTDRLNFVDKRDFGRHMRERLPKYRKYFEEAALKTGFDWRLLAAIGYQESHWRSNAVSPTGVRGIMMLTRSTARQVGVSDRRNARESILGGARYLRLLEKKIPERIDGYDRMWFTLAAYNVGFGHLEDARVLTERDGSNPDRWMEVKQRLPLLSRKKFYSTVKHGYARGDEPVSYVENIRNYYDLLVWYDRHPELLAEE